MNESEQFHNKMIGQSIFEKLVFVRYIGLLVVVAFLLKGVGYSQGSLPSLSSANKEEFVKKAKSQGYSESEIKKMMQDREPAPKSNKKPASSLDTIPEEQAKTKQTTSSAPGNEEDQDEMQARSPQKQQYFGYEIFDRKTSKFKAPLYGPVSSDYRVGPGDELIISIWGETELRYKMEVSRDGTIFIENYGQIVVNSLTLKQLEQKLTKKLARIYSGLKSAGGNPSTYLDVSMGKLRSINVYFVGKVENPGLYSVSSLSTVFSALFQAGGPVKKGSLRDIRVIRGDTTVATFDLYNYLLKGKKPGDIRLQNNDIVFVPLRKSTVTLKGAVHTPGIFELKPHEQLDDLIAFSNGLKTSASLEKVEIKRITSLSGRDTTQKRYQVLSKDLGEYKQDTCRIHPWPVHDKDIVTVHPVASAEKTSKAPGGTEYVSVNGHVMKEGYYPLTNNMTVRDLLDKAGGLDDPVFREQTYTIRADLFRYTDNQMERKVIPVNLDKLLDEQQEQSIDLQHRDRLVVYGAEVVHQPENVFIYGEVEKPGEYSLQTNTGIHDLILQAGGLTREAYKYQLEVYRVDPFKNQNDTLVTTHRITIAPDMLEHFSSKNNFQLQHHDMVIVRKHPDFEYQQVVTLKGEVKFPGTYPIMYEDESLTHLIQRAGGFTNNAFIAGIQFYRKDSLRIVGDFRQNFEDPDENRFSLKEGDRIFIPKHPGTVEVTGAVNNPGIVHYREDWNLRDYIEAAGDYSFDALERKTLVYYPGGNAKRKKWFGWHPKIREGSRIHVPTEPEREPLDITRLLAELSSVAASVATIIFIIGR